MHIISVAIQKGGSGKTTTTVNLAGSLRDQGHRVLLIDLDPQANLTQALGIQEEPERNIYRALKTESMGDEVDLKDYILETKSDLDLVPASLDLANAELELVGVYGREKILKRMIEPLGGQYDFLFVDCPPAIGMLTVNALVASHYVLMPLQAEFLPLKGVQSFLRTFQRIKRQLNGELDILGFVLTKYDPRKTMNREVLEQLESDYGELVFLTRIRTNIALATAQSMGIDIFRYDRRSNGAEDYRKLGEELLLRLSPNGKS